jgi:hypothetical protein
MIEFKHAANVIHSRYVTFQLALKNAKDTAKARYVDTLYLA